MNSTQSLLDRRAHLAKDDPTEELIELHLEVQEFEKQFKECVEIATFLLSKNRQLDELVRSSENLSSMKKNQSESD